MGSLVLETLEATAMLFSSALKISGVLLLTVSAHARSTNQKCQDFLEAVELLSSEEKEEFFEDDELVHQHKVCTSYLSLTNSDDTEMNSDFGIKNEVDYWDTNDIYDCKNGLMLFSGEYYKRPIDFKFGTWYKNQQIKSYKNSAGCCFIIKLKRGWKTLNKEFLITPRIEKPRVKIPRKRKYKGKFLEFKVVQ